MSIDAAKMINDLALIYEHCIIKEEKDYDVTKDSINNDEVPEVKKQPIVNKKTMAGTNNLSTEILEFAKKVAKQNRTTISAIKTKLQEQSSHAMDYIKNSALKSELESLTKKIASYSSKGLAALQAAKSEYEAAGYVFFVMALMGTEKRTANSFKSIL